MKPVHPSSALALVLMFVLLAVGGGAAATGLMLPLALGAQAATDTAINAFTEVPTALERRELAQASNLYAANGELLATFFVQNRLSVPLDEISPHMINAVVAIEDERFFEHNGIDVRSIIRAGVNNLRGGATQGASTITQQYVKNRLIDAAYHEGDPFGVLEAQAQTLPRKAREMALAMELERTLTKEQILEGYLNLAQFGVNNIFGVETAAQFFFSKSAADLTPVEAATIAGITNAPGRFDPIRNPEASQRRRDLVLYTMNRNGFITDAEFATARALPIAATLNVTPVRPGCQAAGDAAFFCDYVINEIRNSPEFGDTEAERMALLQSGGLTIMTTLDMDMQAAAAAQVQAHVPNGNSANLDAAIVSVEPGSGFIRAMAQNAPFDPSPRPAAGATAINFSAGFGHGSSRGFQPGSTIKPFVMAQWLAEPDNQLGTWINASRARYNGSEFQAWCVPGHFSFQPAWDPGNAVGQRFGMISPATAMYHSVNTAFVNMATQIDLCNLRDTMWNAGLRPTLVNPNLAPMSEHEPSITGVPLRNPTINDIEITPSMVLGIQNTSPLALAAAYATFATGGIYCEPIAILSVTDRAGNSLPVPSANCQGGAMSREIALHVSYTMERSMFQGTGRIAQLAGGRPSAGKTGTTNGNSHTWFIGYTSQLSTAAWVGSHRGEQQNRNFTLNGRFFRQLFGSSVAAPMWRDFMNSALAELPAVDLLQPLSTGEFIPIDANYDEYGYGYGYGEGGGDGGYQPAPSAPEPAPAAPAPPAPPAPEPEPAPPAPEPAPPAYPEPAPEAPSYPEPPAYPGT